MSLEELQQSIINFRDERNWEQFHQLKDLLIGLGIEVSELSELFLWKDEEQVAAVPKEKIEEEISDIFIFLTYLCNHFDIDLIQAVKNKVQVNAGKYPVEKSFGRNEKYNALK